MVIAGLRKRLLNCFVLATVTPPLGLGLKLENWIPSSDIYKFGPKQAQTTKRNTSL